MIYPEKKFIFCGVYGAAVMEFRSLFFRLWRGAKEANEIYNTRMATNTVLDIALEHFQPLDRNGSKIMNSKKAILVREPLERFLSSELYSEENLCLPLEKRPAWAQDRNGMHWHCPIFDCPNCNYFSLVVNTVVGQAHYRKYEMDMFFRPQFLDCGAHKFPIDHIAIYDPFNMQNVAKSILTKVGLEFELNGWGETQDRDLFSINIPGPRATQTKLQEYYTAELASKIAEFYKMDYELFNIEIPDFTSW